jgi:hypothetical protein
VTKHHPKTKWVVAGLALALILAACSSSPSGNNQSQGSTTTTPASANSGAGTQQADGVNACKADYKVLQVALAAYNATAGSNPAPPAPWSASTYASNFAPLVSGSAKGGPYMHAALDPTHYVIEYDTQGNVWIEPAGMYDTTYNPAHAASDRVCQSILG